MVSNYYSDEYAEVIVDFGGRVEELALLPQSAKGKHGEPQQVLLSHNGNAADIKENAWWKGMFLVPWANRIAYVSQRKMVGLDSMIRHIINIPGKI